MSFLKKYGDQYSPAELEALKEYFDKKQQIENESEPAEKEEDPNANSK